MKLRRHQLRRGAQALVEVEGAPLGGPRLEPTLAHRRTLAEVFRNESEWHESPLTVRAARFQFLERFGPHQLELATQVAPLDYRWRLGNRIKPSG